MSDRFGAISINPETEPTPQRPKQKPRPKPGQRPLPKKTVPGPRKPKDQTFLFASRFISSWRERHWAISGLCILVLLIIIYGAGGFFLAPSLLTGYISDTLQQTANMGLTAGEARFNPFTLQLRLRHIATTDTSGNAATETPLLTIDQFLIDLNLMTLLRNGIACNSLEIQGLTLSLTRHPDASYNLPSLVADQSSGTETEPLTLSRLPLLFSLNNIKISDSKILFDDRLTGKKHNVEQIKLDLPTLSNFSFAAKEYIRPHFSAIINGSPVELTGEAALPGENGLNGLKTNLACNIDNLDLPLYFAYLPKSVPLVLSKGKAQGKIQIAFVPAEKKGGRLTLGFQLATTEIELGNTEQTLVLTAPAMEIEGRLQPLDGALRLQKLHVQQPQLSADPTRVAQDMAQLFPRPAANKETPEQPHRPLNIDSLTVENGTLQLVDKQQQDSSKPPWTAIQLMVKNFSTAPDPAKDKGTFTLSGKQEKNTASLTWEGSFNSRGVPGGTLHLNAIPADTLLSFLDPQQGAEASGTATLRGHFTFDPTAQNGGMATLIDATTEIHDLTLLDQKKSWLTAKTVLLKGTKFKENDLDLGAISFTDGVLTLNQDKLPPFLKNIGDTKKSILIQDLDFSGNATLQPQEEKTKPLQLTELRLKASNLTAKADSQNNFELATRINQAGMLKVQGLTTLFPLRAQLSLVFAAIPSEQLSSWLPDAPLFQQSRATIHGKGTYRYPEASFSGTVQLASAVIRDNEKNGGLAVNKAEFNDITIKTKPLRVGMNELILDTPQLTWQQDAAHPSPVAQIGSFLHNLLTPPPNKKKQQQDSGSSALPVIQKISFDNGTINHVDQRLNPPWSPAISQIKGSISNLQGKNESATTFEISGLLETVPFTLSGSADFLTSTENFTTRFDIKELPLSSLSAQIVPLLDIDPKSGRLSLSLTRSMSNGGQQGEAVFLFSALRPVSAQADTALPLALLTDDQEQTKLLIPLATNNAQPLFSQAIATFKTLLVKAEVAPLLLAGTEFSDLQDRQFAPFPAGLSEMDASGNGKETLQRFAALLAARPHLGLTLTGMADPIHDRAAILKVLEEKEKKRVALKNEQRLQAWQDKQKQKEPTPPKTAPTPTQGKIIEQNIPPQEAPPAPLSPEPVAVTDSVLQDLAQERAMQVYDFCTTDLGIASGRITLGDKIRMGTPETPGNQVLIGLKYIEQLKQ